MAERANTLPVFRPENNHQIIPTSFGHDAHPKSEARGLIELARTGETIESLRALIGFSPERRATLRAFDLLVLHLPRHPERMRKLVLRKRCNGCALSDELRAEVIALLKAGWPQTRIVRRVPVGPGIVLGLSKEIGAAYLKPRGRGRRFSAELTEKIIAGILSGKRNVDLQREFQMDDITVRKFRRSIGDYTNRRQLKKLSTEQIEQAVQLVKAGGAWRDVARVFGVVASTPLKHTKFRKLRNVEGYP